MIKKCLNCDRTENETPLLTLAYREEPLFMCPQCLPVLIHKPQNLAGKLFAGILANPESDARLHDPRPALKQIRDTAAELLNLYAMRAARRGHAFKLSLHDYEAFAEGFPFEETPGTTLHVLLYWFVQLDARAGGR